MGRRKKKYTKHSSAVPHAFIENWVFSNQVSFPQGAEKSTSVYFLGRKPEHIQQMFYTGAQPCTRMG